MRYVLDVTLVAVLGLSLQVMGCAEGAKPPVQTGGDGGTSAGGGGGGGGGEGGSAGEGGTGGTPCTEEVCDGVDNDCDNEVDEGCECLAGESEPCYTGPEGTNGVGLCKGGTRTCDPATNKFGPCMGEVLPAATDVCNGLDENCNGTADDGLPDLTCGIGACASTAPACVNGALGTCVPGQPKVEVCDGLDNDCDQLTDETFPLDGTLCDSGLQGVCATGQMKCSGSEPMCVPDQMATDEVCDDLDNDCNGTVDDGIPGTGGNCSTGAPGVCGPGTISCQGGLIDCFSITPSSPEVCDGKDNDCDGMSDENNPGGGAACSTGQPGACAQGTLNCVGGMIACTPNAQALPEVCDGVDNNCDGQSDEGNPGAGQACSCGGSTVCNGGLLFCQGCTMEVDCNNNLDDDGDGAIDCADSQCALGCDFQVGPCGPGQKLLVLSSTDIPKSIVDNTTVSSTMSFTETAMVKRVVVQFNITHTWASDLDITLRGPNNVPIDLSSDNGSSGDNYSGTILHDGCGTPVANGAVPFAGCFSPEAPLAGLNNQPANGVWTLQVADDAGGDTGTLTGWSLALCVQ
jgi:subtilisin-like proprotein convertase family protein